MSILLADAAFLIGTVLSFSAFALLVRGCEEM